MPTYRYECTSCEVTHEFFHSMSEKPKRKCPDCGGRLERLIGGGGGVLLKGSGFYTTDYRSESYKSAARKDSAPDTKPKDGGKAAGGDGKAAKPPKKKEG